MFSNCISLTSIDFSLFEGNKLKNLDNFIRKCSALVYIDISSFSKVLRIKLEGSSEPNIDTIKINKNWQSYTVKLYPKREIIIID